MLPDIASLISESVGCGLLASSATADIRAGHAEHVAQHPKERRVAVDIDCAIDAVDFDYGGHSYLWAVRGDWASCWRNWPLLRPRHVTLRLNWGFSMLYRRAGTALESLALMVRRAASNRSHSALSGRDGMVTVSPWSRPASAASTVSSAAITISVGRLRTGRPAMSQNSVAVAPGRTACTRTPLPASS